MPWSINNLVFTTVDRELYDAEPVDTELTRVGQDGTAFQVDAYRAATQQLTTTVQKSAAASTLFMDSCKKLERQTLVVTDQHGRKWTVYVRSVRVTPREQINGQYLIIAMWRLVPRSERP